METTTKKATTQREVRTLAQWAHALSDLTLANHLQCAANQPRYLSADQRRALMREAAARLEEGMRA